MFCYASDSDRQKVASRLDEPSVVMWRGTFSLDESHLALIPCSAEEFLRFETWKDVLVGGFFFKEERGGSFR